MSAGGAMVLGCGRALALLVLALAFPSGKGSGGGEADARDCSGDCLSAYLLSPLHWEVLPGDDPDHVHAIRFVVRDLRGANLCVHKLCARVVCMLACRFPDPCS